MDPMQTIYTSLQHLRTRLFVAAVLVSFITCLFSTAHAVGVAPAIVDVQLSPGQVVEQTITVVNTDDASRTFQLKTENFTPGEEPGVPVFDGGAHDDFPSWVSFSSSVLSLEPYEVRDVSVKFSVPRGSIPGDYYGVIFVKSLVEADAAARTALLVFMTVEGSAEYGMEIVSMDMTDRLDSMVRGKAELRVQNSGNVYIKPSGDLVIDPVVGGSKRMSVNPEDLRIMPKQSRAWSVDWGEYENHGFFTSLIGEFKSFALGPVKVTAEVEVHEGITDLRSIWYWVFPWRTTIVLLGFIILYVGFRTLMLRRK